MREEGWLCVDRPSTRTTVVNNATLEPIETVALTPDIDADIRALPLPDDYADEMRAIHVIEHFYAWEAMDLVREWVRVLKPGGELAIECPSLDKVLALAQVPQCPPEYVHWALYGDPRYKEPAMCHRWAYTEKQLKNLMQAAGLTDLRVERPKFHIPVRDMRVVGVKPVPETRILRAVQ